MELVIKGKGMEVPEQVRGYIQEKIGKLSRHVPNLTEGTVELAREDAKAQGQRHVVQVTLSCSGTLLRAEERSSDFPTAVDKVTRVLNRQIERYKGKLYRSGKKTTTRQPAVETEVEPEESEEAINGKLVRVKHFQVKPMSDEEALEQMELLGHDFFIFYDTATDGFSVIYRRKEGDYGVIHPELA